MVGSSVVDVRVVDGWTESIALRLERLTVMTAHGSVSEKKQTWWFAAS